MMSLLTSARSRFWMLTAFILCAVISWQLFVLNLPSFTKIFTSGIDTKVNCSEVTQDEQKVSHIQLQHIFAEKKQRILQHQKSPDTSRLPKVRSIRYEYRLCYFLFHVDITYHYDAYYTYHYDAYYFNFPFLRKRSVSIT